MMDSAWAARLQAVFELSPTILTVTGLDDGRIVEVNNAFLLATGYDKHVSLFETATLRLAARRPG